MKKNIFISTSIAYANAAPHIGFAMELIQADCLARFFRQRGHKVFFLTGTDEHGSKIFKTAQTKGMGAQEFVDANAAQFQRLCQVLHISNDDFIRTTSQRHKSGAQAFWQLLQDQDLFEKKEFTGKYCTGCEAFLTEKDLDADGNCPHHLKKPETLSEENYFFALGKFEKKILQALREGELRIFPESRGAEIRNFVHKGLRSISFSRPAKVLPWGIDVPGDSGQTIYVWADALTNYLTALGFGQKDSGNVATFWENAQRIHLVGKDILRFHAVFWPAMLMGAGVKIPGNILTHGFLTCEGQKMSKSLGNVVDPFEICETFGADSLRFFILHEVPFGRDADFSRSRFVEIRNSFLANGLGNLLSRVVVLAGKAGLEKFSGKLLVGEFQDSWQGASNTLEKLPENFQFENAIGAIFKFIDFLNKKIDREKPWQLLKTDLPRAKEILQQFATSLQKVACALWPFLPTTCEKMAQVLGLGADFQWRDKFGESQILFAKIESKAES